MRSQWLSSIASPATAISFSGVGPDLQQEGGKHDAERIFGIVTKGRGQMPSFKEKLKPEEIANVAGGLPRKNSFLHCRHKMPSKDAAAPMRGHYFI
ncbi:c-type cytochrome [Paenibacillus sp. HW567]|uniref:c-type cytochrome n=1 Tax=Paenibacillus sp. HW567 TaxID=1034769 RepID=UPI0003A7D865|nr:c-type cytochrome [Paenibacillus sp. HW567]